MRPEAFDQTDAAFGDFQRLGQQPDQGSIGKTVLRWGFDARNQLLALSGSPTDNSVLSGTGSNPDHYGNLRIWQFRFQP